MRLRFWTLVADACRWLDRWAEEREYRAWSEARTARLEPPSDVTVRLEPVEFSWSMDLTRSQRLMAEGFQRYTERMRESDEYKPFRRLLDEDRKS